MSGSPARNPGLDLLRALAIALVLLAHAAAAQAGFTGWRPPEWLLRSGVYGVELFFVLSGYLIGGILLRMAALRPGWRGWLVFMLRRWLRTLPLYFLWLAVLALAWPPAGDLPGHLLRYATLTQNLWRTMPDDGWFAVSWSLTIEEWFYLGFSAVLLGASALSRRAGVAWLAIGLFLAGPLAARLWLAHGAHPVSPYKIAALRLDAIAYGVALARLGPHRLRRPLWGLAGGLALLALLWSQRESGLAGAAWFGWAKALLVLPALAFALMFPAALRLPGGWWGAAAVRQLSAQSYTLYLVHLTMLDAMWRPVTSWGLPGPAAMPLGLAAALGLSWLMWKFVEKPILARRPVA